MSNNDNVFGAPAKALLAKDPARDMLADRLPARLFLPYLASAVALALAYGSSFFLSDAIAAAGYPASTAGAVVSTGTIATLVGSLFAGRVAERIGVLPLVAAAASIMAAAMTCFTLLRTGGLPFAYAGGLLLGLGWAIFYMLAPLQIIHTLRPSARLEALTLLSGSQMLGIGLSAPLGRALAGHLGGPATAYGVYAVLCFVAAVSCLLIRRRMIKQLQLPMQAVALAAPVIMSILRTRTAAPVLMMSVAACTFAGLSTFQSLYAASRGMNPDIFFLTFTAATVALRFSVASMIGRLSLTRLALALFVVTLLGIVLLIVNHDSLALYVVASLLSAIGYGLTYSTLNAMAVNLADTSGLSIPVASQVFTLGYFIGLFGFPMIAGGVTAAQGVDTALLIMAGLVVLNIAAAARLVRRDQVSTDPTGS